MRDDEQLDSDGLRELDSDGLRELATRFGALNHPLRIAAAHTLLRQGRPMSRADIAARVGARASELKPHLRALELAGLVERASDPAPAGEPSVVHARPGPPLDRRGAEDGRSRVTATTTSD